VRDRVCEIHVSAPHSPKRAWSDLHPTSIADDLSVFLAYVFPASALEVVDWTENRLIVERTALRSRFRRAGLRRADGPHRAK
jgi:hypothetical protein